MGIPFVAGMTWGWTGVRGTWVTPAAEASIDEMLKLHVNWITLSFGALQDHPQATEIRYTESPTVTDEEISWAVRHLHGKGVKVCLKPVVNCANGTWRAHINFFDVDVPGEPSWTEWFASYERFMLHYAHLAETLGCDMLCIGCEMVQADRRETEWRSLIAKVRAIYKGPITYNCDKYQEDHVTWWDAVDVISSSGYYPSGRIAEQFDRIQGVVDACDKPFLFMEAGCPSRTGSRAAPNDWSLQGSPSEEEQDAYYAEWLEACASRPWIRGFMLWDWPARLYSRDEAAQNSDYCMYGKRAEQRIAEFCSHRTQG